jgi:hypothetical protein
VLQITADSKKINPGMIFMMMLLSFLIQNKLLELLNKFWKVNYFLLSCCYIFIFAFEFFFIFLIDDFATRLILLAFINVRVILKLGLWGHVYTNIVIYKINNTT